MGLQKETATLRPDSELSSRVPLPAAICPTEGSVCCSPGKLVRSQLFRNFLLGQSLSLLVASMSVSSASLEDRGVSLPCLVNFLNYSFICVLFFTPLAWTRPQLTLPWWRYACYAMVDVEANTLSVLAFRFTSITSVSMLDAFSIPTVLVLSRLFLKARYTRKHFVGVALCLTGLALTIVSDLDGDDMEESYPHALRGDVLCILGAALYAGSNVMQEDFVKNHNRAEFLGMAGIFGVAISGVQTLALERHALAEVEWTTPIVLFVFGYALCLSVMYSWTSLFLEAGDAAVFNLSLLTSDVYALLFSYLVENHAVHWLYFVAFTVIFCGLVLYHCQPPPTSAESSPLACNLGDFFVSGGGGVVRPEVGDPRMLRKDEMVGFEEGSGSPSKAFLGQMEGDFNGGTGVMSSDDGSSPPLSPASDLSSPHSPRAGPWISPWGS